MADERPLVVYAGAYALEADARYDFEATKAAHRAGLIGRYESALFSKDGNGSVRVLNTDSATRASGAKWGLVTGAVVGLLFPPSILAGLIWGGGIGTLVGHLAKGWGHKDIRELGEALEGGQSGVVVIAEATSVLAVDRLLTRADRVVRKQIEDEQEAIRRALEG
jgi:uncharacterized membrane protein